MKRLFLPLAALAVCYLILFGTLFLTYGDLPLKVASHFDISGRPNGWMSRGGEVEFTLGMALFLPIFTVGMLGGAKWIPARFINIPHRAYWLAPERRGATARVLLHYGLWLACLTVLLLTGTHELIVQANTSGDSYRLNGGGMSLVLGGFLAGLVIWSILLKRRFRLPK
jgi:hypothetical protein